MRPQSFPEFVRRGFYDSCEERLALPADTIGHHWLSDGLDGAIDQHRDVAPTLPAAHEQTGLSYVRETYGFRGNGQTVAVIDSGIAYTHQALGAGFGQGYRVVGGWDFTEENDANPYDDGPYGFHGTHVAGIIGSDDSRHTGVAPDVDLVALRVFNDQKQGYLSWVEQALQWVHTHRNGFENPITTVNLSLGTSWNSDNVPIMAALEDEFAQLEADGILIAVSAGNSFQEFDQQPGVSYPAASPYVVPVASVDANGDLSYFSQRNGRVLAAPGEYIGSSVPDHVFGADGQHNDFGYASGTSMAAPYVAGASVLLREAMQFVGYTDITQDTLYDHFWNTADVIHDSATALDIHRINLRSAFDALMPADEDAAGAYSLEFVDGNASMAGMMNRLDDVDTFTFTVGYDGEAVFSLAESDGTTAAWQAGNGQTLSSNELRFQVAAGQTYTVALTGTDGLSHYSFDAAIESAVIDLGAVDFDSFGTFSVSGEAVYRLSATADGFLSVLAGWNAGEGNVQLQLFNEQQQLLASVVSDTGSAQIDALVGSGEAVYLRVGANGELNLTAANLVDIAGGQANVLGTSGNDSVTLSAGVVHRLSVNGFSYEFAAANVTGVAVHASAGVDEITIIGGAGNDTAAISRGRLSMTGNGYSFAATDFETVVVNGGGGTDVATLHDSAGDDTLVATPDSVAMTGDGFSHRLAAFSRVNAYASGGYDIAMLYDSAGNDVYGGLHDHSFMYGSGFYNYARGFDRVNAYAASGGNDMAYFWDSAGDDVYGGLHDHSFMYGSGFYNYARGFESVQAYSRNGGNDLAIFYASKEVDTFVNTATYSMQYGTGYRNYVRGFAATRAQGDADDRAYFFDLGSQDSVYGRESYLTRNRAGLSLRYEGTGSVRFQTEEGFAPDLLAVDYYYQQL